MDHERILESLKPLDGFQLEVGLKTALGRAAMLVRLLQKFTESERSAQLLMAVRTADIEGARLAAHSLKTMAATFGMEPLRQRCLEVELAVRAMPSVGADSTERSANAALQALLPDCDAIDQEFQRLARAVGAALEQPGQGLA